jgi:hypothetical protein
MYWGWCYDEGHLRQANFRDSVLGQGHTLLVRDRLRSYLESPSSKGNDASNSSVTLMHSHEEVALPSWEIQSSHVKTSRLQVYVQKKCGHSTFVQRRPFFAEGSGSDSSSHHLHLLWHLWS